MPAWSALAASQRRLSAMVGMQEAQRPWLKVGSAVEIQWKARIDHPFGWWLGKVKAILHDCLVVEFVQYPESSVWRCLEVPLTTCKASVAINNGCILG